MGFGVAEVGEDLNKSSNILSLPSFGVPQYLTRTSLGKSKAWEK